jgi:NAD-dependent DNA ligase
MRSKDVRILPCSDHLKEVIHCCLGIRGKRYESAKELIDALRRQPKEPTLGRVSSLKGKRLSFTGFLERPRAEAVVAARKAGATVQSKPGQTTDLLVRGRPNALQLAGKDGGSKLIEVRRLADQGIRVTVIGEKQFWKLAETKSRPRAKKAARK